jgi:ribosomal-protein-alanine N-acetyltransferase
MSDPAMRSFGERERQEPDEVEGVRLRPMELEDLDQVIEIERESFQEPWCRDHFVYEILLSEVSEVTVAVVEGAVAGYTVAWLLEDAVHLANVAVRKDLRGKGIGRKLVEAVLDRARSTGAGRVLLEVRRSNLEAQNLYRSLGFIEAGVRKNYYQGEDAILMEWRAVEQGAGEVEGAED